MTCKRICAITILLVQATTHAQAGDWPQILGPNRNGVAVAETLLPKWPANGPAKVWSRDVGQGFAGVAIKDGVLVLFHRQGEFEIVEAMDAGNAKARWKQRFDCDYESGMSSDSGPRCVPLIADGKVFVFGAKGDLRCLDLDSGDPVWSRDTRGDFAAPEGYFGAGSTPVLFQDRLIVNVGGRDNAGVVAFSTEDGSTLWQNFDDTASYSSPIVAAINGSPHAIVVTRLNTVSLNPVDGKLRFQFPFGMRGPTVNGATPVVMGDHLFVSSSYRVGSVWAKVTATSVDAKSSQEKLLATQYATPIQHDGVLFAVDGRQDIGSATLKCIDPAAQQVLWEQDGFDYGTLIKVNNDLLFLTNAGELIRFEANKQKYLERQRCTILNPDRRGYRLPAISEGRLFVRDSETLKCLQVGE